MRSLFIAGLFALAGVASAQSCGSLAVTGSGAPGTSLQIAVSGAHTGDFVILVIGDTLGTTSVPLPMGGALVLGLATPFLPAPMGVADAAGAASLTIPLPAMLPAPTSLHAQAAQIGISLMPFGLTACASNVADFTIG